MHRTPKHQLADHLLGTPLLDWIDQRRPDTGRRTSWLRISLELRDATGGAVVVTPETLRTWHDAAKKATAPAAVARAG